MPDTQASTERLPNDRLRLRSASSHRIASDLLCNSSVQNKAVRFGSLEPVHVTLAKQCILPLVVVLNLAICTLTCGQPPSLELCALGLVAFLITAQIFSPLDVAIHKGAERTRKVVSRVLLEWTC